MSSCVDMDLALIDGPGAGQQPSQRTGRAAPTTSDYNSDDQEFHLPACVSYLPATSHHHRSADDLLYHDHIDSDIQDCCSDHYEPTACSPPHGCSLQLVASQAVADADQMQLQLAEHQSLDEGLQMSAMCSGGSLLADPTSCYQDEYEYENISTIRHYPVPMSHVSQQQQVVTMDESFVSNDQGPHQHHHHQHHHQQQQQQPQDHGSIQSQANEGQQIINCQQQPQHHGQHQQLSSSSSSSFLGSELADYQHQQQHHQQHQQQQQPQQQQQQIQQQQQQQQQRQQAPGDSQQTTQYLSFMGSIQEAHEEVIEHADHEEHNMLHNALMRSPEKLKLIDSIITLLNYASNYNQRMLAPLLDIKRCIERDLEVVLSDTTQVLANGGARGVREQDGQQPSAVDATCCQELATNETRANKFTSNFSLT